MFSIIECLLTSQESLVPYYQLTLELSYKNSHLNTHTSTARYIKTQDSYDSIQLSVRCE